MPQKPYYLEEMSEEEETGEYTLFIPAIMIIFGESVVNFPFKFSSHVTYYYNVKNILFNTMRVTI